MYPNLHNPFADDEEQATPAARGIHFPDSDEEESTINRAERRQRQLEHEVMRTAQSAMDSSSRSLCLIYDSEKTATATAEELVRQGEALKRTEKMVDNMAQDMKTSQKHINSIKSFWGDVVNYVKGSSTSSPMQKELPPVNEASNRLQYVLAESKEHEGIYEANHPNLRKLDLSGFGASFNNDSLQKGYAKTTHLKAVHQQIDNSLDEMSKGLSRLKNLGLGLEAEIDDQDVSLDGLLHKMDSTEGVISSTNRQLKNLK